MDDCTQEFHSSICISKYNTIFNIPQSKMTRCTVFCQPFLVTYITGLMVLKFCTDHVSKPLEIPIQTDNKSIRRVWKVDNNEVITPHTK